MKLWAVAAGAIAGAAAYATFLRPRHLRWGTTSRENARGWPGDEFMPHPLTRSTRAITIHRPAETVWPWIAQIGQDRAGFYSYTSLENLARAEMRNADRIHPEWQHREAGDKVWLAAKEHYDGKAHMIVASRVPSRALVLVAPPDWDRIQAGKPAEHGVWSFILNPIDTHSCRLIARTLGGSGVSAGEKAANFLFWEPAHFVMETAMLRGIKERAEAPPAAAGVPSFEAAEVL